MEKCTACNKEAPLKEIGWSSDGKGFPVTLCKECRHPTRVIHIRNQLRVKPKAQEPKPVTVHDQPTEKSKKKKEKPNKPLKKPRVGRTGKTERKRNKK